MAAHLEESLQRDIDRIRSTIAEMSDLAAQALDDSLTAFTDDNRSLANVVILRDQYIDEKEKEIDHLCQDFLVKQMPVGEQLRFAYACIKMVLEIERVGDYAESIARHVLKLQTTPAQETTDEIARLARMSIGMFRDAVQAFLEQREDLASSTIVAEAAADALKREINIKLIHLFRQDAIILKDLDALMTIVRRFERVSDQARNISMEVLYLCTGELAKHPINEFHVVFVDEHNSCRSIIAEAIAESLQAPGFTFMSAGLEPKPVDTDTQVFLAGKGMDVSTKAPQAVFQVPGLDCCQVIVALAPEVHRAFPKRPGKVVFLDWPVPDLSASEGTEEEVKDAYERTFDFLQSHIHDLVNAIVGSQTKHGEGEDT